MLAIWAIMTTLLMAHYVKALDFDNEHIHTKNLSLQYLLLRAVCPRIKIIHFQYT